MGLVGCTVIPMPRRPRAADDDRRPEWSKWLIAERESRGWKQREFAELIHVSQQSLSGYERGMYRVPEDVAEQIARALNLPHLDVRSRLGMFVPDERNDDEGEVITYQLPVGVQLTAKQRKAIAALIDAFVEQQAPGEHPGTDINFPGGVDVDLGPELRPAASDR